MSRIIIGTLEVLASRHSKTLISYAQKIICTTDTLQSSLLEALGSALRRLTSISELGECTSVCVRVSVSKPEMQQLVFVASTCRGMHAPKCNAVDVVS